MEATSKELGILFADIADSSHLFSAFGDAGARDVLLKCIAIMRGVVEASPGRVVERIGDELLTAFPTPESTTQAAVNLQTTIANARKGQLPSFLALRIGFHFGAVLDHGEGLFGDTVYTANRVCSLAKGNQILTTGDTVARFPEELRKAMKFVERRALKGTQKAHDIMEVPWEDPHRTVGRKTGETSLPGVNAPLAAELELTFKHQTITMSSTRPTCTIGRSTRCDFHVELHDVSRLHARIEYRNGRFVLIDVSSNGTIVKPSGGDGTDLCRSETHLEGSGTIHVSGMRGSEISYSYRSPLDSLAS